MLKIFRKIRQKLLIENKVKQYLLYAIGEIILVVIGILIAVSINNYKQSLDLKKEERNMYGDLIQELQNDLEEIQGNLKYNNRYLLRYKRASEIILNDPQRQLIDTLAVIATELIYFSDFKTEETAYNNLAMSGKLELITNKEVLTRLQNLGIMYNYINRLEKDHETFMFTVVPKVFKYLRLKPFQIMMPEQLYDYQLHNDIELMILIANEKDELYKEAERDISDLINILEEELN
jgi:hypothetical protein